MISLASGSHVGSKVGAAALMRRTPIFRPSTPRAVLHPALGPIRLSVTAASPRRMGGADSLLPVPALRRAVMMGDKTETSVGLTVGAAARSAERGRPALKGQTVRAVSAQRGSAKRRNAETRLYKQGKTVTMATT